MRRTQYDAIVVGAGPNGLAAAIEMARAGRSTLLIEARDTIGGAARSAPLTLPGFIHDVGAAITPLAAASPFMSRLPLEQYGVEWVHPPSAAAHPFDDGPAAVLERSIPATASTLGRDGKRYQRLMEPLASDWNKLAPLLLGPIRVPRYPAAAARLGALALCPATVLSSALFREARTRGLLAGLAAHSVLPLRQPLTAGFALLFAMVGHSVGWPYVKGGTQNLSNALGGYFESLGGEIVTGMRVGSLRDLPPSHSVLLDLTPRQVLAVASDRLPAGYTRRLQAYRYGPGVFKLDYALSAAIPWKVPEVARAATVHLGGSIEEIAASESEVARGHHPRWPFVLLAQQTRFDPSRAPAGKHTAWAYCHVPSGSTVDMTARIEAQIERFAPGFRDIVLARAASSPVDLERMDANLIGGDITGGVQDVRQWLGRPVLSWTPYATPVSGLYICSSSTPPGGGVHGMCGYHAARAALRQASGRDSRSIFA